VCLLPVCALLSEQYIDNQAAVQSGKRMKSGLSVAQLPVNIIQLVFR
jgi:hypothetical protein